jgi:hypothetical protein
VTANDVVLEFVERLVDCILALREAYSGAARSAPGEPLQLIPRAGGPGVRSGRLKGVGDFQLHGRGCHIELVSGEEVDFDWDDDERETFDSWKLSQFAQSRGESTIRESELLAAARSLRQLTEVRPGWFVLVTDVSDAVET